ncbi:MAG: cobalt ECF transporter T component CbiQ [Methanotrichaceae archaeon]|nr:cobalt ECF transporter T component CbiQ [Methanotrichaceae archaeon]
MSHFDLEECFRLESPIHCWEARARVLSILVLIFSVALAGDIPKALAGLAVALLLIVISRLPLDHVARFMKWPALFLLPFVIILPFTTSGDPLFSISAIAPSAQGLSTGLLFFIRGLAAALLALLIVATAPFTVTIRALRDMGLPGSLEQIFLFAYRYIFLLNEELTTMSRSMDSKGFIKRSDFKTARILSLSLAMLLIRSYERAEEVFLAMISRGYTGTIHVGSRREIGMDDILKCFLVLSAAIGIQAL